MPLSLAGRWARNLKLMRRDDPDCYQKVGNPFPPNCNELGHGDVWINRARPMFLYVMYAMLLWALPLGLIAAFAPDKAQAISLGMTSYLKDLPEPLYALFGTGYLGYATLRQWGKIKGGER